MATSARSIEDLNEASVEDLEQIEGIGRKRAEEIIKFRDNRGGFESWDDLKEIPGFSNEMITVLQTRGADWGPSDE